MENVYPWNLDTSVSSAMQNTAPHEGGKTKNRLLNWHRLLSCTWWHGIGLHPIHPLPRGLQWRSTTISMPILVVQWWNTTVQPAHKHLPFHLRSECISTEALHDLQ